MGVRVAHISHPIPLPGGDCPLDVGDFLRTRGWHCFSSDEWQNHNYNNGTMTWEQAMAYEFYLFISLGGHQNG